MQTTATAKVGNAPDLLSGILSVQVRNEEIITEQDRLYCQRQQDLLYKTLDQIDRGTPSSRRTRNDTGKKRTSSMRTTARCPSGTA